MARPSLDEIFKGSKPSLDSIFTDASPIESTIKQNEGLGGKFASLLGGGALATGGYGAAKAIPKIVSPLTRTISAVPKVLNVEKGSKFASDVRNSLAKVHTEKVNEFGKQLDQLTITNPKKTISLRNIISEINSNPDISPDARNVFNKTPKLQAMFKNIDLADSVTLREAQDIINHINTKIPKNIRSNNLDIVDLVNDLKGAQLDAFPEMAQVRQNYRSFVEPYKNVKPYFKFNKLLNSIKNKFGGAEGQNAVNKILPKKMLSRMGGYRRAANFIDIATNPFQLFTKRILGIAPMVLDAFKMSNDPIGYLFEQETGLPKELLNQSKRSLEKIANNEELTNEEVSTLLQVGALL